MRRSLLAVTLVAFALSACGGSSRLKVGKTAEGEVVEADGIVPLQRRDIPATEAAALAAAQRAAVEKVVGVYISGKTLVEKAVIVENRILARTEGYITKYELVSKGPDGDFYRTKIRAHVLFKQIGEDLKELGLIDVAGVGNPRVVVLLDERVDGSPVETLDGSQGLMQSLLNRGYVVVDRAAVAGGATQNILDAAAKGDVAKASELGKSIGAEVLVTGSVGANQIPDENNRLGGMISYRARASAQAIRTGTGQVLGTSSRDASGLDATRGSASAKALAAAAGLAGEELGRSIHTALQTGAEVAVVLRGIRKLESLQKFQEELRTTYPSGKILLRRFGDDTAEISVVGSARASAEIAAHIARMKTVNAEVDTYTSSRVEATLKE